MLCVDVNRVNELSQERPLDNVLDEMFAGFGRQGKCPLYFVLAKLSFLVNVLHKNVL